MVIELWRVISSKNKEVARQAEVECMFFDCRLGRFPITDSAPFTLTFTNVENRRLIIEGSVDVTLKVPCDRCLSDVQILIPVRISKEIDLEKLAAEKHEEPEDTGYMIGTNLDVDKLIFGEILVGWPMKVLCREDCRGICKRCGANLNLATCQCQKTEPDPRMAAIQDIFNQFKEV